MSVCGQEKMFLIRVKSNRYNVNLTKNKMNSNEEETFFYFRIMIDFNLHVLELNQLILVLCVVYILKTLVECVVFY